MTNIKDIAPETISFLPLRELFEACHPFILSVIRKYKTETMTIEELLPCAQEALYKAQQTYDYTTGVKFTTYAYYPVRLAVQEEVNFLASPVTIPQRQTYDHKYSSSDQLDKLPTQQSEQATFLEQTAIDQILEHATIAVLSKKERLTLQAWLKYPTAEKAAEALGISKQAMSQRMQPIFLNLRNWMIQHGYKIDDLMER